MPMPQSKWKPWVWPAELRRRGVLGINRRNGSFVLPNNPRPHYPRVDNKQLTKQLCHARNIPTPETYALIERHGDIPKFFELIGRRQEFVIKPARGSEGRGIMVITGNDGERFHHGDRESWHFNDVTYHLAAVLAGLYSLAGQPDAAIIEQRIVHHPVFEQLTVGGTPDIRIVLYRCVPIMAMVRLPTLASRGRANLHQGAVAAGINLASGCTVGGVCQDRAVMAHPDTGHAIAGLQIPRWRDFLKAATDLAQALELGYLGVDFVLDAAAGPVVLEANARPGLSIQLANRRGLVPRLNYLDSLPPKKLSAGDRRELIAELSAL
jgi:alpha-L-glutamate ligase-like protein